MKALINFAKKEVVLSIAIVAMVITCFFVPIDKEYLTYFDYNTLVCLFCILAVVAGLKSTNIFWWISKKLVRLFHTRRSVIAFLVFSTFFFDMIVANDMSLITLLPLSYIVLHSTKNDKYLAITFVLQTIAANMGGMLTPYGNPQNLYLYSYYNINTLEFFQILLPQCFTIFVLLFISCQFIKNEPIQIKEDLNLRVTRKKLYIYICLFILVILTIFRVIPYMLSMVIVLITTFIVDKSLLKKVDYPLLATFCVFFVFSGNMARIPAITNFISIFINKNILVSGIISCQFISNVPTAIFLSKFTLDYSNLLISVNVGSLGVLISSLASLITLKEFLKHQPKKFWAYLGLFTLVNTIFLVIILGVTFIIK